MVPSMVWEDKKTNTTGALKLMRESIFSLSGGDRSNISNLCILITDGKTDTDADKLDYEVDMVKKDNISIMVVGVGSVNKTDVEKIASWPSYIFTVDECIKLSSVIHNITRQACSSNEHSTTTATTTTTTTTTTKALCVALHDVVFVMDASGSIEEKNFLKMKEFVASIIEDLDLDNDKSRVGVLTFATNADLKSSDDAVSAVETLRYSTGTTNTAAALSYVRNSMLKPDKGDRANAPNIVFVITDGGSNNKKETQNEAYKLKAAGAHIVVVGVGGWTDQMELTQMASFPHKKMNKVHVKRFNDLLLRKKKVVDMICNTVNGCSSNPCRNGGTCVDAIGMYWCKCPPTYGGSNCENRCRVNADVAIAIDASSSIGNDNFIKEIEFVQKLVYGLNLNSGSRVAAETFSNSTNIRYYLNEYTMKYAALNALSFYYTAGTTNTASAIDTMRNNIFTSDRGDRSNVPNIGVVITDGRSNDRAATILAATIARKQGMTLITVGVGNNLDHSELLAVANYPSDRNYFKATNFANLDNIASSVISSLCNNCSGKVDIVFVVDASGSIRNERFSKLLKFMSSIVDDLEVASDKTRVGAVSFSSTAAVQFQLKDYNSMQDVMTATRQIKFNGGRTNTASALQLMKDNMFTPDNGDREDAPNIAIIITDGNSNINQENTIPYAFDARRKGIHMIVSSIGSMLNILELRGMASTPASANLYQASSWRDLSQSLKRSLVSNTCDGCTKQMDVTFILDVSGSADTVYSISVNFINSVIYGLPVSGDGARVAFVSYSDSAKEAINRAYNRVFSSGRGDRNDVRNIAIVVSDGNSNVNKGNTVREADRAREKNIEMYVAAVSNTVNMGEVNGIANDPDSTHVVRVRSQNDVKNAANQLLDRLCG
ncbi:Collagen alpha-5(VI) chain [Lamellibrachia satsuma]|nr:Collagen alpha-5(VI) chain [Lamellibrachia satsuma]